MMNERSMVVINKFQDEIQLDQLMVDFGQKENLHIAFGIGDYFSAETNEDQYKDYGSIKLYYEYWDNESNILTPVMTRPCTRDDFQMD
jgi:hypothetical protein